MNRILDDQTIEVNLPSKIGYERVAMASSAALARMGGLAPARIEDLKSAVAEACINAMQHGNKWRHEARVVVNMNISDASPSGLGVFIIQHLVDEVKFNQTIDGGHTMVMEIRFTE